MDNVNIDNIQHLITSETNGNSRGIYKFFELHSFR